MKNIKDRYKHLHLAYKLISLTRNHIGWSLLGIAASVICVIVNILGVYIIKLMIDNTLGDRINLHISLMVILAVVIIMGVIAQYLMKYASGKFGVLIIRDLRKKMFSHSIDLPVEYIEKNYDTGDMVSRYTNDTSVIQDFFENSFSNLIYYPLLFAIAFIYMALINLKLLLLSFLLTPVFLVITGFISKPIGKFAHEYQEEIGNVNSIIHNYLSGIRITKAFNLEDILTGKCWSSVGEALKSGLRLERRFALLQPMNIIMYEIPYVLCVIFGGYLSFNKLLSVGSVVAFIQLLHYVIEPTAMFPGVYSKFKSTMATSERLFEILEQEKERKDGSDYRKNTCDYSVEFENVTFGYVGEYKVLNRCNFKLERGKTTALVGASGSGKSTIINLLCGFYNDYDGSIRMCGEDIKVWSLEAIRSQISVVTQDTYLFPDTVAQNIAYGNPDATKEEIIEAAKQANAHDFIIKLEDGYDTLIGERGIKLSAGQQQRIGIARAVLKKASIIILDEPTSSLDVESENLVKDALKFDYENKTVLIIAHRLTTVKHADNILVMDAGRIIQMGTHSSLIEQEGKYRQLYSKQSESYNGSSIRETEEAWS